MPEPSGFVPEMVSWSEVTLGGTTREKLPLTSVVVLTSAWSTELLRPTVTLGRGLPWASSATPENVTVEPVSKRVKAGSVVGPVIDEVSEGGVL